MFIFMLPVAEELAWEHSGTLGVGPVWGSEKGSFWVNAEYICYT
jgi:hypothetical protein